MPEKHSPSNEGTDRHERSLIDAARGQVEDALEREKQRDRTPPTQTAQEAEPSFDGPPSDSFTGYKIIDEIHRGGQGVVYKALQESTKRKVAIKVMKEGPFAGSSEKARFEREVQILGQLKHPNIVTIYDSGTAAGSFYFVMDYISGQPLDVYLAAEERSIEETLKLFGKICEAVNAAHLHGVIHRDLKPGNIRVDPSGEPHILDFGLAKVALGSAGVSPADAPLMTMTGQFVGSLPWASPEQAEGVPSKIDIRTDVYSLGVILYQMLTGKFPYDVIGNMRDVLDRIMKAEPARPSTIRKQINDEVETIVLKCLSKERERRYQTAGELARDVGLYLGGEPIEAKRDSLGYVLRKQLRRYRVPAATAAAFVLLLGTAAVVSSVLYVRAENEAHNARLAEREQRRLAHDADTRRAAEERERKKAEAINEFVTKALVSSDPNQRGKKDFKVTDAMQQAINLLDAGELKNQPETEAALRLTIAGILNGNARSDEALRLAQQALQIKQEFHPGDHPDVATSLDGVARCLESLGRPAEALSKYEAALEMNQRLFQGDHPNVALGLNNVAACLDAVGRLAEALSKMEAALEMRRRLFEGDHPDVVTSLNNVAVCLHSLGRTAEALPKHEAALEMNRRLYEGDHPHVASSLNNIALCLQDLGLTAEALPKYEAALEMRQRLFEGVHPDVATSLNSVAVCLQSLGRSDEALPKLEAALKMVQRLFEGDHPLVAGSLNNLASCLNSLGRPVEALPKYEAALEMVQRLFEGDHPHVATSLNNVAYCLQSLGRPAEALSKYEAALEMTQRLFEGDHPDVAGSLNNVAACLNSLGRSAEALPKYEAALEMRQRLFEGDHPHVAGSLNNVAACLNSLGRPAEALSKYEAALEMTQRLFEGDHPDVATSLNNVAACLNSLGRSAEALPKYEAALEMRRRLFEGDHPDVAASRYNVAACLHSLGRSAEALPKFEAALEMYRRVLPPGHPHTLYPQIGLAATLVAIGRYAEAQPLLREAAEQCERSAASRRMHWRGVLWAMVKLYDEWHAAEPGKGYDAKAAQWRAKLPAPERAGSLIKWGVRLLEDGRPAEAEAPLRECLETRQEVLAEGHWLIFNTMSVLGESLAGQGADPALPVAARIAKLREAEPLLLAGYEGMKDHPHAADVRKREALERIVKLYESWHAAEPGKGYADKAAEWRLKLPPDAAS